MSACPHGMVFKAELGARRMLQAGDRFPDGITLQDDQGANVHLDEVLANGPAVLFFYPADHTPGCTREACSFRDHHAEFRQAGATVFGISSQGQRSHAGFRAKHDLPYRLLTDRDGRLAKQLGLPKFLGVMAARATFVVAPDHTITHAFRSQLNATKHVDEALEAVRRMVAQRGQGDQATAPEPTVK